MSPAEPAPAPVAPTRYVGLATRALAFVIDAAVINGTAILTVVGAGLVAAILQLPESLRTPAIASGSALYLVWSIGYFATFWSTTGQTPGNRIMRLRVCTAAGAPLRPGQAVLRCGALALSALPLGAGFLLVLVDDRRRALHDLLTRTVVTEHHTPDDRPGGRGSRGGRAPAP